MTETATLRTSFRFARSFLCALILILPVTGKGKPQTAGALSQIKKVYVGSLGDGRAADTVRQRIAERLRASRKVQITQTLEAADATVTGTARIWVTGYISAGVHPSNRQPVEDGFLSADLVGKGGATLWSYLVTPSKFHLKSITNDLADQLVKKLLEALADGTSEAPAVLTSPGREAVSIHGAGATFPWPLYQKWFESFGEKAPNVHIRYDPIGSESGIQRITRGELDFAASDMPLSDQAMERSSARFIHIASVLGAVVPIYNLQSVDRYLNFTPEALAGIHSGSIKKWNDRAIGAANPGVALPDTDIVVIHRSDGSGTTFAWTDYLSKISPEWKKQVGSNTTVSWPVGRGAERNEGVAAMVRETPGSIGYVELIYAIQNELRFGAVRNAAGNFVKADIPSVTAAASSVGDSANSDFRVSITNAAGKQAYPIATFTWLLLPARRGQTEKTAALLEFLRWMLTAGQKECAGLGYAPLPSAVAAKELQFLDTIK